ncbi:MAG: exodeoxyribonuclease VII small subunit [Candidatus Schekmanbacteria bacterium]|nr:exodeoxyribonuclease VII small subunit [Candidatus Schekmanbacteria bacterium]
MKKNSFEESFSKLEEIVKKLEEGNISLEESVALFQEGIKLNKICNAKLEEAEKKIEILLKDADGNITYAPFEVKEDDKEEDE